MAEVVEVKAAMLSKATRLVPAVALTRQPDVQLASVRTFLAAWLPSPHAGRWGLSLLVDRAVERWGKAFAVVAQ